MSFRRQDTPVATVVLREQNDSHLLFWAKGRRDSRVERHFTPNLPGQRSSRGPGKRARSINKNGEKQLAQYLKSVSPTFFRHARRDRRCRCRSKGWQDHQRPIRGCTIGKSWYAGEIDLLSISILSSQTTRFPWDTRVGKTCR